MDGREREKNCIAYDVVRSVSRRKFVLEGMVRQLLEQSTAIIPQIMYFQNGQVFQTSCTAHHTAADYGPCTNNALFKYNARDDYRGCKYRTLLRDYKIKNKGTIEENVVIDGNALSNYQELGNY